MNQLPDADPADRGQRERARIMLLVEQAADGSQAAWDSLVDRFSPSVWAIVRAHRLEPEDTAAAYLETWQRLLDELDRVEQPDRVGAWLGITAEHVAGRLSRVEAQVREGDHEAPAPPSTPETAEAAAMAVERSQLVNELVDSLPLRTRTLLRLCGAEPSVSYKDISEILGMPVGSIGPTRARAFEQLRRLAVASGVSLEDVFRN